MSQLGRDGVLAAQGGVAQLEVVPRGNAQNSSCWFDAVEREEKVVCHTRFLYQLLFGCLDALLLTVFMHLEHRDLEQVNVLLGEARPGALALLAGAARGI
eukprot:7624320-Pyramimonas_sp.AAC.1